MINNIKGRNNLKSKNALNHYTFLHMIRYPLLGTNKISIQSHTVHAAMQEHPSSLIIPHLSIHRNDSCPQMTALHGKYQEIGKAEAPRRWEDQGIREGRKRIRWNGIASMSFCPTNSGLML